MNQDIVYEILKHLYLCPEENDGALLARKMILSTKKSNLLNLSKLQKPIVFSLCPDNLNVIMISHGGITVYWGDGKVRNAHNRTWIEHTYFSNNIYVVRIFSDLNYLLLPSETVHLYSIGNLKNIGFSLTNLKNKDSSVCKNLDTSEVTDMSYLFRYCGGSNWNSLKNWNTHKVTDMSYMFQDCNKLDKNIGKYWDTSNVINMTGMFTNCGELNKNIGKNWVVAKVTNMSSMFRACFTLNRNIGKRWDTSSVTDMSHMFDNCTSLKKNIGKNWNMSTIQDPNKKLVLP
jgi:hypothetical protein